MKLYKYLPLLLLLSVIPARGQVVQGQQVQQNPQPIKPDAHYRQNLRRWQKIQADFAEDSRKFNEKHERKAIESKGLEAWLSANVPQGYGLNPSMELFTPLPGMPSTPLPPPTPPGAPPPAAGKP